MRFLIALVLALALPAPADACSCGVFDRPTAESCRGSKRAFAGTVAGYRWPTAYDEALRSVIRSPLVEVELAIDRVWRGDDVPSTLVGVTGSGGGDCGIHPVPGTRFVVCDDEADGDPPGYNFCSHPAFEDPVLEAALGASSDPARSWWRPRPLWWREPLLLPLMAVALFASIGRAVRRVPTEPVRYRVLLLALGTCALVVVAIRAIAHVAALPLLAGVGPVLLAAVLGAGVGFQGQRTRRFGGWFRGLAAAVAFAALPVSLGYAPLHLPWNQESAVACSRARAEAILSRDGPLEVALAREPYACTDLGTQRYRIVHEHCLLFADGDGGEYAVCREDGVASTFIGPEH